MEKQRNFFQIFYDFVSKTIFYKPKTNKIENLMKDYGFSDVTKDFFEGMRSIGDLTGERYFNDFRDFPKDSSKVIGKCWSDVGHSLYNAMGSFATQNNLPQPLPFNKK